MRISDWSSDVCSSDLFVGRTAADGLVGVAVRGNRGAVAEVNAETDFVAKNEQFQQFVSEVTEIALETGDNLDALLAATHPTGATVKDTLTGHIATIGENMNVRRAAVLTVEPGVIVSYVHNAAKEDRKSTRLNSSH